MHIIACVDDRLGMLFNGRRLSRDEELLKDIRALVGEKKLWVSSYSDGLFARYGFDMQICDDDFPEKAAPGDFCFVEDADLASFRKKIESIILYRWNRRYPSDTRLDPALLQERSLTGSREFPGSSHEKITREVYV